ncbi:MAG: hypothetical protein Q8S84_03380 [bacterium]|nr:hypothetical protein [bacterium]
MNGKSNSHSYCATYLAKGTVKSKRSHNSKSFFSSPSALSLFIPYISLSSAHLEVKVSTLSIFGVSRGVNHDNE